MLIKKNNFLALYEELGVQEEDSLEINPQDTVARAIESHGFHSDSLDKEALLDEIRQEGEEIIRNSKEEADKIRNTAQEEVRAQIDSAIKNKLKSFEDLETKSLAELENLFNACKEIIRDSENQIVEIAVELASKIINRKAKEDPEILRSTLKEVLDKMLLNPEDNLKINFLINPKDSKIVEEFLKDLSSKSTQNTEMNFKTDDNIAIGSCIVETPSGSMDLNFTTQLEMFKQRMQASNQSDGNL